MRGDELAAFVLRGTSEGSADDARDGFIHLSSESQLQGTIDKHFAEDAHIFALDCTNLLMSSDLKWEESRNGKLFPHLYRALRMEDVRTIAPIVKSALKSSEKV